MAWNGTGIYLLNPAYTPEVAGTVIDPLRYNGNTLDIAAGITNCITKDGQNVPTANLSMGGFKHINVLAGTGIGDSVAWGQSVTFNVLTVSGLAGIGDFTTTGNTILGSATTNTLNVGSGGIIKDASGNVGFGAAPTSKVTIISSGSATVSATNISSLTGSLRIVGTASNICEDGISFVSGGGGGAAITLGRDASNGTLIKFYTNPTANGVTGGMTLVATVDQSGNFVPAVTNTGALGSAGLRWSTVNGVLGNYSGLLTASAGISTTTLAMGGALTGATTGNFSGTVTMTDTATLGSGLVGFRGLPAASVTTGAFVAADAGKVVYTTGGVTVPNATMADGDVVVIQENTGSAQTITATITTLRQTGTANTGNRTLKAWGRCAILFKGAGSVLGFISGDVT